MNSTENGTAFDYIKLIVENVSIWPLIAIAILIWILRNPELLKRLNSLDLFGVKIELEKIREKVEKNEQKIIEVQEDVESGRRVYEDLLRGVDVNSPLGNLRGAKRTMQAGARGIQDFQVTAEILDRADSPEELYAAAIVMRERRPLELFSNLLNCLEKLSKQPDLGHVRLNTVWTLTSALHKMLITAIRDQGLPKIPSDQLARASQVLDMLELNPRVIADRPDNPAKGIRGPINHARSWLTRGYEKVS